MLTSMSKVSDRCLVPRWDEDFYLNKYVPAFDKGDRQLFFTLPFHAGFRRESVIG